MSVSDKSDKSERHAEYIYVKITNERLYNDELEVQAKE